jgi:glutaminyl-peptide cyclotransferase
MRIIYLATLIFFLGSCESAPTSDGNNAKPPPAENIKNTRPPNPPVLLPVAGYDIVKRYKHDKNAFTQVLLFRDDFLYESTGQYGDSTLRKVDISTGKVLQKHDLPKDFFAEGIALVGEEIFQLTWQSGVGFVYSLKDFKVLREFRYSGQGWGLTFDGTNLYHSDGSHVIRVVNPKNYETIRTIVVNDSNGNPLMNLNELEWVKGEIWANIWHSENIGKPNHIARIDPKTGKLLGWINLAKLSPSDTIADEENTMNGIAYDPENERIFVTGKNWKNLYEIKLKELAQ